MPALVIPGVKVTMGGTEWTVPPLTLGMLRRLLPQVVQLREIGDGIAGDEISLIVEIVTAALQRNYPDIMSDQVLELLDLGNAVAVLHAVLTGSGLKPGEAAPVAISAARSAASMAPSPPAADTASRS